MSVGEQAKRTTEREYMWCQSIRESVPPVETPFTSLCNSLARSSIAHNISIRCRMKPPLAPPCVPLSPLHWRRQGCLLIQSPLGMLARFSSSCVPCLLVFPFSICLLLVLLLIIFFFFSSTPIQPTTRELLPGAIRMCFYFVFATSSLTCSHVHQCPATLLQWCVVAFLNLFNSL